MRNKKIKTAVVGCGAISSVYLNNMINCFKNIEVVACCARRLENAQKRALEFGICAHTYDEILKDPTIELIVILTPAPTHYELIRQALEAGKHVYTEKTMTINLETAKELMQIANQKGLYLGAAPDTFLGSALQMARRVLEEGRIGEITSFTANANRNLNYLAGLFKFLRMPGGGITYDYGVYYLTALISLLGPAERVCAKVKNRKTVRINECSKSPEYGQEFVYTNESQVTAILEMESGIMGSFQLNGDSIQEEIAIFYIYGTKGILKLTDPNQFGGKIEILSDDGLGNKVLENHLPYCKNSRGVGVSEMADAIIHERENLASKELAYHVLDIIEQMGRSSETESFCKIESTCKKPDIFECGERLMIGENE